MTGKWRWWQEANGERETGKGRQRTLAGNRTRVGLIANECPTICATVGPMIEIFWEVVILWPATSSPIQTNLSISAWPQLITKGCCVIIQLLLAPATMPDHSGHMVLLHRYIKLDCHSVSVACLPAGLPAWHSIMLAWLLAFPLCEYSLRVFFASQLVAFAAYRYAFVSLLATSYAWLCELTCNYLLTCLLHCVLDADEVL